MPTKRPGAQHIALVALGAIVPVGLVAKMVIDAGSLSYALQLASFFLGAGGLILMFFRWRLHGDTLARTLTLAAVGIWGLAVGVASVTDSGMSPGGPGFWLAGLALLIGFAGGAITLRGMYRAREKPDTPT